MCGIFVFALITQSSRRFCWNDGVFEFPKEHQRCSRKHTDFNTIEIMCLRQAKAAWVVINNTVAELVEATVGGIFLFGFGVSITQSSRRFCWNDCVFEFPKEHQRCSRKHTDFNAIEIMCLRLRSGTEMRIENGLRQAQAPSNKRIGGWACRSHYVWIFCICFNITKFTKILWNDSVFEFSKEHQRCS